MQLPVHYLLVVVVVRDVNDVKVNVIHCHCYICYNFYFKKLLSYYTSSK